MIALGIYPEYSGAGVQALWLSERLIRMGVETIVLAWGKDSTNKCTKGELVGGIPVWRLKKGGSSAWGILVFTIRMFRFLVKNRHTYDIVHVHGAYWYGQAAILISKLLRKKVIVRMTLIGDDDPLSLRHKQRFGQIGYRLLAMADKVISISSELSNSYHRAGLPADRLIEISNGVDTERFCFVSAEEKLRIRQNLGLPLEGPVVAFTGEVCQRKGVDLLIESWREVICRHPSAQLLLIGPTDSKSRFIEDLHNRVNKLELSDKILFAGRVDNVHQHLQSSDIFVFPSRRDSTPSAVLEAMACGLPCVVMETEGVSGIIANEVNGLIFELENSRQLAHHVLQLISEPALRHRLGNEARKTIVDKFSIDFVSEQHLKVYQELLSPATASAS